MKNTISTYIPYLFIGLPFVMTFLVYYFSKRTFGNQWRAIHTAVQWTAIFYIIAVAILLKMMLQQSVFGYMLILLIVILAIILIFQWKHQAEVILKDGLRLLWRVSFLLFSITYSGLLIYVLVRFIQLHYIK